MAIAPTSSVGQYLVSAKNFIVAKKDLPAPETDEIQIAIKATTLCGSDMHYYQHGKNGSIEIKEPLCLGHEAAGEVVAIGQSASFRVGDRVAIECGVPCGSCDLCHDKRYNLCGKLRFRGSGSANPHFQGTMQNIVNHPSKWAHLLPKTLSYEEGALLEPLSVAVHACRRAQIRTGSSCTVIGAGAIGLLCAVAARVEGCEKIAIADISSERVNFALDNGFADVGYVVEAGKAKDFDESLDIAKTISSSIQDLQTSEGQALGERTTPLNVTKSGGKTMLVGMGVPYHTLPIAEASAREIDIIPTWRYANCYPRSMEIMEASKERVSLPEIAAMITHRFNGLPNVPDALQMACRSQDDAGNMVIKVVLLAGA